MGRLFSLILLIAIITLSGCGEQPVTVSKIVVTPSPVSVGINKNLQFTATAYSSNNRIVPTAFSWSVSGGIGTIAPTGLFSAGALELSGSVIASAQGVSGSASVSTTTKGSISGIIKNSQGTAIKGITVYLNGLTGNSSISDSNGRYTLSSVPPGSWEVDTADTPTYVLTSINVSVTTAEASIGDIKLLDRFSVSPNFVGTPITSVTGTVVNQGSTMAKTVTVFFTFYDIDGSILTTAVGSAGDIPAGGTGTFSAFLASPIDSFSNETHMVSAGSY